MTYRAWGLLFVALWLLVLTACTASDRAQFNQQPDQCLRVDLFERCMWALPAGPQAPRYNDWDEVVSECRITATAMSMRQVEQIKPECRP